MPLAKCRIQESSVVEGQGLVLFPSFLTAVTPARDYLPAFESVFAITTTDGPPILQEVRPDPIAGAVGMEQMVSLALSPDGRRVFTAERETDSVALFSVEGTGSPSLLDRRGSGSHRLRFDPPVQAVLGVETAMPEAICGMSTAVVGNQTLLVIATGCADPLSVVRTDTISANSTSKTSFFAELDQDTVGLWNFNSSATGGPMASAHGAFPLPETVSCGLEGCAYSRPRNANSCRESGGLFFTPAAFLDVSGGIGAAVLPGPACASGVLEDWALASDGSLSALAFLAYGGSDVEALRFDGNLNAGLWVARDIEVIIDPQPTFEDRRRGLPRDRLGLAVWFTVEQDRPYAGLAAAQSIDTALGCAAGWSLGYSVVPIAAPLSSTSGNNSSDWQVVVMFSVAVEGGSGSLTEVSAAVPGNSWIMGDWHHVAASYDGVMLSLHINGKPVNSKTACPTPPCGQIIYPASRVGKGALCLSQSAPFTIGTHLGAGGVPSPHQGAIHSLRIVSRPLSDAEAEGLYTELAGRLHPVAADEYWAAAAALRSGCNSGACLLSPDPDFAGAALPREVRLRGRFKVDGRYRCRFQASLDREADSDDSTLLCSGRAADCPAGYVDTLSCVTPRWKFGFLRAEVVVIRYDSVLGIWRPIWRRLCLEPVCGYVPPAQRVDSRATPWWAYGDRNLLYPGLTNNTDGNVLFIIPSAIYVLAQQPDSHGTPQLDTFSGPLACIDPDQCGRVYGRRTCINADAAGRPCVIDGDCAIPGRSGACALAGAFSVQGAKSIIAFVHLGIKYIAVANTWNGVSPSSSSPLLVLHDNGSTVFAQEVAAVGVQKWLHLTVNGDRNGLNGVPLLSFAASSGPSRIYRLQSSISDDGLIDEATFGTLFTSGATSLCSFEAGGLSYIVVSSNERPSVLLRVGIRINTTHAAFGEIVTEAPGVQQEPSGSPVIMVVEEFIEASAALDVIHIVAGGWRLIVFAVPGASPVYAANAADAQPEFTLIQMINSAASASTVLSLADQWSNYLLIAQAKVGASAHLLRWNGSSFLGPVNPTTSRADLAGGQVIATEGISAIVLLPVPTSNATVAPNNSAFQNASGLSSSNVSAGKIGALLAAVVWNGSAYPPEAPMAYLPRLEVIQDLSGPSAVVFEPNKMGGGRLYTGLASGGIAVFNVDPTAEFLTYDCLVSLGPGPGRGQQPAACAQDQSPIRQVTALLQPADGKHMYAASALDSILAVFTVDSASGKLSLRQLILANSRISPLMQPGVVITKGVSALLDMRGMTISNDSTTVFVTCGIVGAVAALERNVETGKLSFADAVYDGERLISSFRDLQLPSEPGGLRQSADSGSYPARLGGDSTLWATAAHAIAYVKMGGGHSLVAVAAGFAIGSDRGAEAIAVYSINDTENSGTADFNVLQLLECAGAISLESFWVTPVYRGGIGGGGRLHLLAAGRALSPATSMSAEELVRVYAWNGTAYSLHHVLSAADSPNSFGFSTSTTPAQPQIVSKPITIAATTPAIPTTSVSTTASTTQPATTATSALYSVNASSFTETAVNVTTASTVTARLEINSLAFLSCSGSAYLAAAATRSNGGGGPAFVRVYRWVQTRSSLVPHQDLPASGATDVCAWPSGMGGSQVNADISDGAAGCFFAFADGGAESATHGPEGAAVVVYELGTNGRFTLLQRMPLQGAYGVSAFQAAAGPWGLLLAVAQRLSRIPFGSGDYSAYDQPSSLLRWNRSTGLFDLWQILGSDLLSVSGGITPDESAAFGGGVAMPVEGLRGATRVAAFESGGETYLAIAQGLCSETDTAASCSTRFAAQPRSAVLQLDAATGLFGDLSPFPSSTSFLMRGFPPIAANLERRRLGTSALRISAGRAVALLPVSTGDGSVLLVACSLTQGAVVFSWSFNRIEGLVGATASVDLWGSVLYVLSPVNQTLTAFTFDTASPDSTGRSGRGCPLGRCLNPIIAASYRDIQAEGAAHIIGARSVAVACRNGTSSCNLIVRGGLPRDERLCGPMPLDPPRRDFAINFPTTMEEAFGPIALSVPPACIEMQVSLAEESKSSREALLGPFASIHNGSLLIDSGNLSGDFRYHLRLNKKVVASEEKIGSSTAACATLLVSVLQKPSPAKIGNVHNITMENTAAGISLDQVFCIIAALPGESRDPAAFAWDFEYDNADLFAGSPLLLVETSAGSGDAVGVIRFTIATGHAGTAIFSANLHYMNSTESSLTTETVVFAVTVLIVNQPPIFSLSAYPACDSRV